MTETTKKTITKGEYANYLKNAVDFDTYQAQMEQDSHSNPDPAMLEYIKLNRQRMQRVEKTYHPSETIMQQLAGLKYKSHWLVITEHWCGDAAQSLPVMNRLAELSNGKITLKLVYRDQNLELMDAYLTNGSRSIPRLIQLDEHNNVTGIWGPRPTEAQSLVMRLKADPVTAPTYGNELHLWYAKDRQVALEGELSKLLMRANLFCPDCIS